LNGCHDTITSLNASKHHGRKQTSCYDCMWRISSRISGCGPFLETDFTFSWCAEALYLTVKSLMHAIRTEDWDAQQDAVHWMMQFAKPKMIRRWAELTLANAKQLIWILKVNTHHIDLKCTDEGQAKLTTLMEGSISQGASGGCRVHRWWHGCFSLAFGDKKDYNDVSGHLYDDRPPNTLVDPLTFWWLRETYLPMLHNKPLEYPKPDQDNASRVALLLEQEWHETAVPSIPPPHKVVLFCPVPGQVRHLKRRLTKYFVDHVDIFHMSGEMGNDERTEMQLKFQDSWNRAVFVTTPKVGRTSLNITAASQVVRTQKFWVLNEQQQAFAQVLQLWQNRLPHTWLQITEPVGYDYHMSDFH